jgi:hypothetical protein
MNTTLDRMFFALSDPTRTFIERLAAAIWTVKRHYPLGLHRKSASQSIFDLERPMIVVMRLRVANGHRSVWIGRV